jgi:probable HAF family extracellular repeat protein
MNTLRQLRNFWIPAVMTIVLACFSDAVAQTSYTVTDLGRLHDWNMGCAMGLNNKGWTEIMDGNLPPGEQNSTSGQLLTGRAVVDVDGLKIDLGTLGGKNSWTWYGGINDQGEAVGFAETAVPDPDGEDLCGFGTHLTCRPFLWKNGHMSALPIPPSLGGNNGQASNISNNGQIAGYAQTTVTDSGCPPYQTTSAVIWHHGKVQAILPTVGGDPDGVAFGINNQGQATGYSGTCTAALHGVLWENGTAISLPNLGVLGAIGNGISDQGEIIGQVASANGETAYAAIRPNPTTIISLNTLPGDVSSLGEGINNQGQAVGSTTNSNGDWSHAFLWQNKEMIDINTLFPASSNLYATMANEINDKGQISGMAIVLTGPQAGNIHAFLATPVNASVGKSIADVARTLPKPVLPANIGKQFLRRSGLGRLGQ